MPKPKKVTDDRLLEVSKQTAGGVTGAMLGGIVGGPVGAFVGGVAGAMIGDASAKGKKPIETVAKKVQSLKKSSKLASTVSAKAKRIVKASAKKRSGKR